MTTPDTISGFDLSKEMDHAEEQAWNSLARYKFWMFGYWCGVWVHLNRISGLKRPNPWKKLVDQARQRHENRKNGAKETH